MSRHYFDTEFKNCPVQVVLGYDRPLDCFFLTVMYDPPPAGGASLPPGAPGRGDAINDNRLIVYSNLADPAGAFNHDLDYYRAKLSALGISVPESMFRETEQDAVRRAGNRQVQHHADGRIETIC